jgi:hypothetical protein
MIALETRVMVNLPSHREVLEEVKLEVLKLVGEKVLEFQEEQFIAWFGKRWERERDARGIILCPQCGGSPGFERRGTRERFFNTRYGKWKVLCSRSLARGVAAPSPPS